jgi:T5SS/PEP-CTERM-associated repeat protein
MYLQRLSIAVLLLAAAPVVRAEDNTNIIISGTVSNNGGANFYVGNTGTNNTLTIISIGVATNISNSYIGNASGANYNFATVSGSGSAWYNKTNFYVGKDGAGNSLTITNGGKVVNGKKGLIGNSASASNNIVTVTGTGSIWSNTGVFTVDGIIVGNGSAGNMLTIAAGGKVFNASYGYVGYGAYGNNNYVTVTGAGSLWNNVSLYVGSSSAGNSLIITNGGSVRNGGGYIGSDTSPSNNSVTVTGAGSSWTNGMLYVGSSGVGNTLTIADGGQVNGSGRIGELASATSNTVTVTGAGSLWNSGNNLSVGREGAGNSLTIAAGGKVVIPGSFAYYGYIGYGSGASNNTVTVTGAGSLLTNQCHFSVGHSGAGNRLTIADGGKVAVAGNNVYTYIGYQTSSRNNSVTVTGTGSILNNQNDFYVGKDGAGNSLTIAAGGQVVNGGIAYIGGNASSSASNNSVTVTGAGSVWSNNNYSSGRVYVGGASYMGGGEGNSLIVTNGGQVVNAGYGFFYSSYNFATVTGTGSVWRNNRGLFVAYDGNRLTIADGGQVVNGDSYLGYNGSSNSVTVTDTGSVLNTSGYLYVGYGSGSRNTLAITNGGVVNVNGNALIDVDVNNQVTVAGGSLVVTNGAGTGCLEVRTGALVFNGGTATANQLLATNGANSVVAFNSGTLTLGAATVSKGSAFVVGNGTNPAVLNLQNGVSRFADHLIVSSNAQLVGNGTIAAGNVTVQSGGTLAPGNSIGSFVVSNNLTLAGALNIELANATGATGTADSVTVLGTLDITGGILNFTTTETPTNSVYVIARYGALTGSFAATNNLPTGYALDTADASAVRLIKQGGNPAGAIDGVEPSSGSWTGGYPVVISGSNLCNGADITNVTLCGVAAAITSQSATQVVVTAGAAGAAGLGDVRVYSTSYGETVKSNGFTYVRETQAALVFTPTSPQACFTTNALSTSGGSGTGAVSYTVLSGPGAIVDGSNLTVTAGSGTISVRAAKAQDDRYYQASVTGSVMATKATAGVYLQDLAQTYDGTARNVTATTMPAGLTVTFTYDGNGWAPTNVGSYAVTGTVNDANWQGSAADTLVVGKASQTITFPAIAPKKVSDAVGLAATASSGLPVSFAVDAGPGNIAGNTNLTFSGAGDVYAKALQAGDGNWAAAPDVTNIVKAYSVTPNIGPYAGGNAITITNGHFGTITNVTVGGVKATISGAGDNWVTITVPATGSAGVKDIVIQTSDNGDTTLAGAYTVNPVGMIVGPAGALPALVTLTNTWLNGTNGIILAGAAPSDQSGISVSKAGDVNGDGFADLLIGASQATPAGRSAAGETYLVFGTPSGFPSPSTLTNTWLDGTNGIVFAGARENDNSGISVSGAGDVNGDGFADLLIGAENADPAGQSAAGETYLVFGRSNGFPATVILTNTWLDGTNGVLFAGAAAGDYCGRSVSGAGDVNQDGIADLLIGAYGAAQGALETAGAAYLVFGRTNGFPALVTLTDTWLDGANGVLFAGTMNDSAVGTSLSDAGDVNQDGIADLLIGANGVNSDDGEAYLVFGRSNGFPALVTLTNTWLDGANGVLFAGVNKAYCGKSVSGAGDVNQDGIADLLIGAPGASPSGLMWAGETYLVFGRSNGFPALVTLTNTWLDGTNGVLFAGKGMGDCCGMSVSGAGDVNGDGIADLLIGAPMPFGGMGPGESDLVYGRSSGFPALVTLANTWLDGTNGAILAGAVVGDRSGWSVSEAGDVNADGLADLLIGAYGANPSGRAQAGETYLVLAPSLPPIVPSSGSVAGGFQVAISGRNLGNGADITNVTLCGVAAAITSQSATQVVVTAGAAGAAGLGDVRVYSTSHGETVKSNAFTYTGLAAVTLAIRSQYGTGAPPVGVYTNAVGAVLTNAMNALDTQGATQYVCAGWAMTGQEPVSGTDTQLVMTVTNDAVLTWLWTTNYWLSPTNGPHGTVDRIAGWFSNGETVVIGALPDSYYHFTNWSGSVSSFANPLNLLMDGTKAVQANFAANWTTNKPTPQWWLAQYGFTNNFEEAVTNDLDGDGVPTGDEYVSDTIPTNGDSYLRMQLISPIGGGKVIWAGGISVVQYLEWTANLSNDGPWVVLATNLPPTAVTNEASTPFDSPCGFYRVRAVR